jgi:hypothetical protein
LVVGEGESVVLGQEGLECEVTSVTLVPGGTLVVVGNVSVSNLDCAGTIEIDAGEKLVVYEALSLSDNCNIQEGQFLEDGGFIPVQVLGRIDFGGGTLILRIFDNSEVRKRGAHRGNRRVREVVEASTPAPAPTGVVTVNQIEVVEYASFTGVLSNITVIPPESKCDTYSPDASGVYGATTLSVTVTVTTDTSIEGCESPSSGLSTGAIVGIAVGSVVFVVVVVAVGIVSFNKWELKKKESMLKKSMAERQRGATSSRPE